MKLNIIMAFILMILFECLIVESYGSKIIFYDNFENWSGWNIYGLGVVNQSSTYVYSGNYSLEKNLNNDPNGGYKLLNTTISRDVIVSGWIYRPSGWGGGPIDRIGLENGSFDGYSIAIDHLTTGGADIWIDKRTGGLPTRISSSILWSNAPLDSWYYFKFYIYSNGTIKLNVYYNNGSLGASVSTEDSSYTKFDRVVIHGGYVYYVDNLEVESITSPLSVKYIEEFNSIATVDGSGKTNYTSGNLMGHVLVKNTAPYSDDTLHDVWVAVNVEDNISPLRVITNETPSTVEILNSAPTYTKLNGKGNAYIHIDELPNNSYVDCAFDIAPSKTLPVSINETYSMLKIPTNYNASWNVVMNVSLNKDVVGNNTLYLNITKYLSNNSYYEDFNNWSGWHQYGNGLINWSSNYSHSGKYSLWKGNDNTSDSTYNDPNGGYYILPKTYNRTISLQGWIYRPYASSWVGPIDRVGLEDSNFDGYTIAIDHGSNQVWIDRRTNAIATDISPKITWDPPENGWYFFNLTIYNNGTITLKVSYNGTGVEVSATDNSYTKFDRITIRGGHPYYVDDLRVIPSNNGFYGSTDWDSLSISNVSVSKGLAYTFDGEYFNSSSNAIFWHNITLNYTDYKAQLNFTVHGVYNGNISNREGSFKNYGFAVVSLNYNGVYTNSSVNGVYALDMGTISVAHGSDDFVHWNESATFKDNAESYHSNLTEFNIWAINKSAFQNVWDPFNKTIWITVDNGYNEDSNHSLTPNIVLEPGSSWQSPVYNFTFNGVPIVWANCTFEIAKSDYSILNETGGLGNKYVVVEKILVIGSYLIKVTKHIVPNENGTYDIYVVVENIGSKKSPLVYAYDLVPNNFTVSDEWVNESYMLNNSGNHTVSNPEYSMCMYWALNPLTGGANGDGNYTDSVEIQNNQSVVIHYRLNGTGEFRPTDAFIVGIDPTHSLLPTTSPKTVLVSGAMSDNFEPLLMILSGLTGLGILIRRRK